MKNKVNLIGRMGAAAEVRSTASGDKVASFSLATTETYKDKNGERQTLTEWHRIDVWGGLAGVIEKFTDKGSLLDVEGKLRTEKWTDKDGIDRYTTKVRANNIILLDRRDESRKESHQNSETSSGSQAFPEEDDLPF